MRLRPDPGLCSGSQFLGGGAMQLFEILPRNLHRRVRNLTDFWMAWLLDVAANHADNRQAIFCARVDHTLDAMFIDHGHMFGGPKGGLRPRSQASRYLDGRLYAGVSSALVEKLTRLVGEFDIDRLWRCVRVLPAEWVSHSAIRGLSECLNAIGSSVIVQNIFDTLMDLQLGAEELKKDASSFEPKPAISALRTGVPGAGEGMRPVKTLSFSFLPQYSVTDSQAKSVWRDSTGSACK